MQSWTNLVVQDSLNVLGAKRVRRWVPRTAQEDDLGLRRRSLEDRLWVDVERWQWEIVLQK